MAYFNPSSVSAAAVRTGIARLLLCATLLPGAPSYALDETKVDLRLSAGVDVINAPGSALVSGRYGGNWGAKIGLWGNRARAEPGSPRMLAGVDYVWTHSEWRAGFGLVWIDKVNTLNGTHVDFDLSLAYDVSDQVSLEFRHFSHGAMFGIARNLPNHGWNLVGVGLII